METNRYPQAWLDLFTTEQIACGWHEVSDETLAEFKRTGDIAKQMGQAAAQSQSNLVIDTIKEDRKETK